MWLITGATLDVDIINQRKRVILLSQLSVKLAVVFSSERHYLSAEFIQGMSQFSVKGDKESKMRFAFRIYDMDNDGFISNGELFQVGVGSLAC